MEGCPILCIEVEDSALRVSVAMVIQLTGITWPHLYPGGEGAGFQTIQGGLGTSLYIRLIRAVSSWCEGRKDSRRRLPGSAAIGGLTRNACSTMGNRFSTEEDGSSAGEGEGGQQRSLYQFELSREQWPIVYSPDYNISFLGMERLHPFDSGKWAKVFQFLVGESKVSCPCPTANFLRSSPRF